MFKITFDGENPLSLEENTIFNTAIKDCYEDLHKGLIKHLAFLSEPYNYSINDNHLMAFIKKEFWSILERKNVWLVFGKIFTSTYLEDIYILEHPDMNPRNYYSVSFALKLLLSRTNMYTLCCLSIKI